ncbi:hypothetical protein [Clostridium sp.]|uniref:hypothetical protein n=1 Tax=Clostridium sp. TaxID=1506 RepID=UPI0025B92355|nr:hypothetical protein [Clostridium sp.]
MGEKEQLKQELQQQLEWVQYRHNMLGIMEIKLLHMKEIASSVVPPSQAPQGCKIWELYNCIQN